MIDKIFQIRTHALFFTIQVISLLATIPIWGAFAVDSGKTASIFLSFDVTGSAVITPYIQLPNGSTKTNKPVMLSNVSSHIIFNSEDGVSPTFSIENPFIGIYTLGALVHAFEDTTVSINVKETKFSNSYIDLVLRPSIPNLYSVVLATGEYSVLLVPIVYVAMEEPPP